MPLSESPLGEEPDAAGAAALLDLFDHAPCGYLAMDASGWIVRVNATFARWVGVPAGTLIGRRLRDLLTTPGRILYETSVAPIIRLEGAVEEAALDFATATGAPLPTLVNLTEQRDPGGVVVGLRAAVIRASARRSYERDLQSREARAASSLIDERATAELREHFIAVLGHDLRNPLAALEGGLRRLENEGQSQRATVVLKLMERSVARMVRLIDDVLDFARGRLGGGLVVDRTYAPLEPVLRQVVDELEAGTPGRAVTCRFALAHPIAFDAGRMAQLVSNLLANALAHGDPDRPVVLEARTADGRLELSVANAGKPIPAAAMERLFQPFVRGEIRASQNGLGLGLYIASEIAKAHEGSLSVSSDAEETRFTLMLPIS